MAVGRLTLRLVISTNLAGVLSGSEASEELLRAKVFRRHTSVWAECTHAMTGLVKGGADERTHAQDSPTAHRQDASDL